MKSINILCIMLFSVSLYAQQLSNIPNQYMVDGNYETIDLDTYVEADGCYDIEVSLSSLILGDNLYPNLLDEEFDDYRENMTATIKFQYAGFEMTPHADDKIWVLDEEDRLVEVNTPHNDPFNLGSQLFFLNIKGNFDFYQAKVVYYSGDMDRSFTIENAFEYRSNKIIGSPLEPYVFDLAPLIFEFNNDNELSTQIVDQTYSGGICLEVNLLSCVGVSLDTDTFCFEVGDNPCMPNLIVNQADIDGGLHDIFEASQTITSDAQLSGNRNIVFSAKECITLESGFTVDVGVTVEINNTGCN